MKTLRLALVPLAAGALLAGCGDDATDPDENPFAAFVGTWTATEFSYTPHVQGVPPFDLVTVFGSDAFSVTVSEDGSFMADLMMPDPNDPLGGAPTSLTLTGSIQTREGDQILIDFDPQSEQVFSDLTVSYSFEDDNTLVWVNEDTTLPVGEAVPATLRVVLSRQQ